MPSTTDIVQSIASEVVPLVDTIELRPDPVRDTVTVVMGETANTIPSSVPLKEDAEPVVLPVPVKSDGTINLPKLKETIEQQVQGFLQDEGEEDRSKPGQSAGAVAREREETANAINTDIVQSIASEVVPSVDSN
jgi:hypothetical protein